jgi:orotate phosphoribosyltransferase
MIQLLDPVGAAALTLAGTGIAGCTFRKELTFASGIRSPGCYMDNRALPGHPYEWRQTMQYANRMLPKFDAIAGVESGGIAHGAALAYLRGVPYVSVRKQAKGHGLEGQIAGDKNMLKGKDVLIVEDVGTTGGSALCAVEPLRDAGAIVEKVFFLSTYGFKDLFDALIKGGLQGFTLCTFEQVLDELVRDHAIGKRYETLVRRWLRDPRADWEWPETAD